MMKIRNGFTLVETMVAISITLLLGTTIMVAVNGFLTREKSNQTANEMISLLNSARNYAVTRQGPAGYDMNFVKIILTTDGMITAYPGKGAGVGTSYFSKDISSDSITVTAINNGDLQFAAGSGKLVNLDGTSRDSTYSIGVTVSDGDHDDDKVVYISSFGTVTLK